jgi:hypothetical protein
MTTNLKTNLNPIPRETALQLCAEIRTQYQGKWYTLAGMQCLGCLAASKGDLAKMCVSSRSDYRGCNLVSARYKGLTNP